MTTCQWCDGEYDEWQPHTRTMRHRFWLTIAQFFYFF